MVEIYRIVRNIGYFLRYNGISNDIYVVNSMFANIRYYSFINAKFAVDDL